MCKDYAEVFGDMMQRKELVLSVLEELQEATESMGLDALIKVALEVEQVLAPFHLPTAVCSEISSWMGIDAVAHRLYPADAPAGLLPLVCKGEGNLLFDAASMLLVGSTSLSLELQVRTVVEMLLWKQYYLCGMIDSKVMLQASRFSLCAEESQDMLKLPMQVLEAIFDADVKASCFPSSFANMWHVYALASVLQCNIYSIYPMFNLKIRPYFNRLIRPRTWPKDSEPLTLHIMWSGELEAGSIFKPRNFVALIHAGDLKIGSPGSEQRLSSVKSLDLLSEDPQLSYSTLKDKFNITKSTFYRWRRQSMEYHKKSVARSTYYAWKHELMATGSIGSGGSTGEVSPGDGNEQDYWSSPETMKQPVQETFTSILALKSEKLEGDRFQNAALMQEAKKSLQNCIATNTSFPYRIFKRRFPGISRSTYYNWRREALLFTPFKDLSGNGEESPDPDKVQNPKEKLLPPGLLASHRVIPRVRLSRFPSISSYYYWLWRHKRAEKVSDLSFEAEKPEGVDTAEDILKQEENPERFTFDGNAEYFKNHPINASPEYSKSYHPLSDKTNNNEQMFVMDVVALANFKAKAKLFLQQRFEEKSFPTFKEFRSYFPLTPRSTYYMWKRALHHGVNELLLWKR
ncbi:hypothetical protein QTP70_010111 [Hemibagrus guttatus]|uniref:Vertnin n=1 Tax=Hemibagrus guttatus TaxID=175788 RepID=A0AAE0USV6_9TELE|nr:hypothetical protein QTP70_010111 [Hemibagrus guttatus]